MHWEDPEMVHDFVEEAEERLDDADGLLLELERSPSDAGLRDSVVGCFHTLKGMASYVELKDLQELCHRLESVLETLGRSGREVACVDLAFDVVTALRSYLSLLAERCDADSPMPVPSSLQPLIARATALHDQHQRIA